jgi:hypothetical protein
VNASKKCCTKGESCIPLTLAEAVYCCVFHSGLEPAVIAERMGVSRAYLYNAANPDREDFQFQARLIIPLTHATGNLCILQFLAREFNQAMVTLPAPSTTPQDIRVEFMKLIHSMGDGSSVIDGILDDGVVTKVEAKKGHTALARTIEILVGVQEMVTALARKRAQ